MSETTRRDIVAVVVNEDEKAKLTEAARREDRALSNWARRTLLAAALPGGEEEDTAKSA